MRSRLAAVLCVLLVPTLSSAQGGERDSVQAYRLSLRGKPTHISAQEVSTTTDKRMFVVEESLSFSVEFKKISDARRSDISTIYELGLVKKPNPSSSGWISKISFQWALNTPFKSPIEIRFSGLAVRIAPTSDAEEVDIGLIAPHQIKEQ